MTCGKKPGKMTDAEREAHGLPARKPRTPKPDLVPVGVEMFYPRSSTAERLAFNPSNAGSTPVVGSR